MDLKQQQDGWQHVAGNISTPPQKIPTERKDSLSLLILARTTGLSGSCVVSFPFWGRADYEIVAVIAAPAVASPGYLEIRAPNSYSGYHLC